MQRLLVRTRHLKIRDALVLRKLRVKQPRRVLDKLQVRAVQLGKRLLVLALHHHLRLGAQRAHAQRMNVFDPDLFSVGLFDHHAGLAALRMRHRVGPAHITRVLRQLRRTRARRRIHKIKLDKPAVTSVLGHHAFERDVVELKPLQTAPQALLGQRIGKADL